MSTQIVGQRVYFSGDTYPIKDRIKALGAHWDADRKQWWIGATKRAEAEALVATVVSEPSAPAASTAKRDEAPDREAKVRARASYKGKDYYVLAETRDGAKKLLAARNGAFQFWAARELTQITKTYGRENYRTGRTEYPTLGGMIRRAEEYRQAKASGRVDDAGRIAGSRYECEECGEWVTAGEGTCWETGCGH